MAVDYVRDLSGTGANLEPGTIGTHLTLGMPGSLDFQCLPSG